MKSKFFFFFSVLFCFFFLPSANWQPPESSALSQKFTLDRLLSNPSQTFQKSLGQLNCAFSQAKADLDTDHSSKSNPGDCTCGAGNSRASWNSCLGCLFVMFIKVYTNVSSGLASAGIDPMQDGSFTTN